MERADNITDRRQTFAHAWSRLHGAVRAREYDEAVTAARTSWFTLLSGPAHEVAPVLEPLPQAELDRHPLLSALLGHSQVSIPARRPHGLRRLAQAEAAASSPGETMGALDRALILVGQADVHRRLGRMDSAVGSARAALVALDGSSPSGPAEAHALEDVYAHLGMTLLSSGARQLALEALEEGVLVGELSGEPAAPGLIAALALVGAVDGDLGIARGYLAQAQERSQALTEQEAALLDAAEAVLAVETADREEAVRRAALPGREPEASVEWVVATSARAMMHWLSGFPGRALASLEHAARGHGREGRTIAVRSAFAPLRAALQLALGHPDAAVAVLERDATRTVSRQLGRARVELVLGRHGAALAQLRSAAATELTTREQTEAAAIEAAALLRFSGGPRVEAIVDHLGALLAGSGLRLPLLLLPASDLGRVSDALSAAGYGDSLPSGGLAPLLPEVAEEVLTRRETAVLGALLEHPSHAAIAAQLNVSVNTVKSQLRSIYRKLGVSTRDEAIAVALDRHLVVERE